MIGEFGPSISSTSIDPNLSSTIKPFSISYKDTRFNLARLATPISAQATPSSRVDINEEISIKVELNSELEVDDIEAEIWLDEVTGHPDHVGAEYSIASPSMSNYSMVDVFSLGPFSNYCMLTNDVIARYYVKGIT